jgi:hypothetical protein
VPNPVVQVDNAPIRNLNNDFNDQRYDKRNGNLHNKRYIERSREPDDDEQYYSKEAKNQKFGDIEFETFLDIVEEVKPVGTIQWKMIEKKYNQRVFSEHNMVIDNNNLL